MMTQTQPWRDAYLAGLEQAAVTLPPARRSELIAQISEHLDAELAGVDSPQAAAAVLERLGDPNDLEVEASVDLPTPQRSTAAEIIALLLMGIGAFALPLTAPAVGVLVMLSTSRWNRREVLTSAGIVGVGVVSVMILAALAASGATGYAAVVGSVALLAIMVLVGPVAAVYAATRPRRA